jgi:CDP-glucose 4,6-dehydratase
VEAPAVIDHAFWRGRRVLVTGHTGFKGSWLSLWLQRMGASVAGYALAPPTSPSLFEGAGVAEGMESVIGDLRDRERLERALRGSRPEVVLHLAAQSLVRTSYADPVATYETNVMGTVHVLDAARRLEGLRAVVIVSSDKCYQPDPGARGHREGDALGGADPYSSSKAAVELVVAAYRRSFFGGAGGAGLAVASARAGNALGGGDWADDRLLPDLVRSFARGVPAFIRNPDAVRPFQHVLEPLSGYLVLAQRLHADGPAFAEAWNFGPRTEDVHPVRWVADRVAGYWGGGAAWLPDRGPHPHESRALWLDSDKARTRLGWSPRWSLDVALTRSVAWYRACRSNVTVEDVREATLADIDAYVGAPDHAGADATR